MLRIGITGGIGMGKSTSATWLAEKGFGVVDTDDVARAVVAPGEAAFEEIVAAFGPSVVGPGGALDRQALAQIVFKQPEQRRLLESITHPRIRERWLNQLEAWQGSGARVAFVVIPLLYETGAESELDRVVCVACSLESQRQRLRHRGWTEEQARGRLQAQMAVEEKMKRAHYVIWTEGDRELQAAQWSRIMARLAP